MEDIAAYKLEAICHRKDKKDYVDLAVLLNKYTFAQMINFYVEKYPYADKRVILSEVDNIKDLEKSKEPRMLIALSVEQSLEIVKEKVKLYAQELINAQLKADKERREKIEKLLPKKKYNGHFQKKVSPFKDEAIAPTILAC